MIVSFIRISERARLCVCVRTACVYMYETDIVVADEFIQLSNYWIIYSNSIRITISTFTVLKLFLPLLRIVLENIKYNPIYIYMQERVKHYLNFLNTV